MMRPCKRIRAASVVRAVSVAATALLAAVTIATAASPAQASTTAPGLAAGLGSVRHVILQAAMGGAVIMALLTIGLLFFGRAGKAVAGPKPAGVPLAEPKPQPKPQPKPEPELDRRSSGSAPSPGPVPSLTPAPSPAPVPSRTGAANAPPDPPKAPALAEPAGAGFSATAPRTLGAGRPEAGAVQPVERHQVALGDDLIEVELADWSGTAESSVHWAPLPYDVPDDGLAFACIGAGDEGCLFVDLAAAPAGVAITGDTDAAVRLAESIVHQLCASAGADQAISVHLVGSAIPRPHPASARSAQTLRDLATGGQSRHPDGTDIVFCELRSDEDADTLARHVASSPHRIVPVVLGPLPGTAWKFTALH